MAVSPLAPQWLQFPENVNALRQIEWASGVSREASGELSVQGLTVSALAKEFGTPLFVLDENDFRARARGFKDAFDAAFKDLCGSVDVYYAGKAFVCTEVARWVAEEGLRLDTCSGGELAVAKAAKIPGENLSLHGNNKSQAEIIRALEMGVGRIVIDSLDELERVITLANALGHTAEVMLRITPGVHASTHEAIATAHEDQKFGLSILADATGTSPALRAVARALEAENVNLLGLHAHIGSQIFEAEGFAMVARTMLGLLAQIREIHGVELGELDLGGGYGIAYTSEDNPSTPAKLAGQMADVVSATCAELELSCPRISIEPGRAIVGPTTFTLYETGVRKDVQVEDATGALHPRRYISVDGGMSDNPRPVLYDAQYNAVLASRMTQNDAIISRVVGKHCESGDIVVKDVYLPEDVAAGDLLAIPATGAYCWALSSNYNYLTRPAVVAVRDGQARLIVRRETEDDLLARDMGV
ncbi:diaminopimelate decarboxylase [Arthrobacter sp. NIO-1057]|uniref:diaminopimelate decarboxylase n=1 Tax=Arthrobacter sp. NIO-1057 TaxID=993071 RepID=UPI00071E4F92|nr:diaminopimelate decarboxylase [Arthrobacter sp. NIO-1057]KSU67552.1 diaminopimelate decarboxylase [Arthrobacter sp. NIO-1057]SCB72228.1 diaminopimelate decarboxylase [Arthrobacter sp. NIO-1057]